MRVHMPVPATRRTTAPHLMHVECEPALLVNGASSSKQHMAVVWRP
jgi:hypothetical protein